MKISQLKSDLQKKNQMLKKKKGGVQGIKSVIKGNIKNVEITCQHILYKRTRSCDGLGKRIKINFIITKEPDFEYYYIDHYACKSIEEFINNKLLKTDVMHKYDNNIDKIKWYFKYNKVTKEKIDMIEKRTKYNLKVNQNSLLKILYSKLPNYSNFIENLIILSSI